MRSTFSSKLRFPGHITSGTTLLLIIVLLSGISSCSDKSGSSIPGEETLEASRPLLKLLDADDTGIKFSNQIEESFELNVTRHINNSNGGGVAIFDANNDGLPDVYFISSTGENKFYLNKGSLKFEDLTEKSGLASPGGFEMAVTAVDINTDGFLDLYVCRGGPMEDDTRRNKLFINNGDLTFTESAKLYGIDDKSASSGANFFDYDLDGDLDLYLLNYPSDFSYVNKIMVQPTADSTTVEPLLTPIGPYDSDRLYRNEGPPNPDGSGGFKDVSKSAGIWNFAYGLSVSVEDFNHDGWPDVYLGNDFIQPDRLYINNRDGTFTDKIDEYFQHCSQQTMGTELADFDNDGLFDLFAADMLSHTHYRRKTVVSTNSQNKYTNLVEHNYFLPVVRNVLQRNNGDGTFSDIACLANVSQTDWSWSGLLADLNNDGWKDLLVTNGYQRELSDVDFINLTFQEIKSKGRLEDQFPNVYDFLKLIPQYKIRNFVFQNTGNLTFDDQSGKWMTMKASWSNGASTADLDGDGDLDYVVNNIDDYAFVYQNESEKTPDNHYIQFVCSGQEKNPLGVGTSVMIYTDSSKQYQYLNPTQGIFSSVQHLLHFGLGSHTTIDSVIVRWPDGMSQKLTNVSANQRITLKHGDASELKRDDAPKQTMFRNNFLASGLKFRHTENYNVDFETTFLLPWSLSDLGPLMATADVNKDGWTDVYVGNSFNKPGGLYTQQADGTFKLISREAWDIDSVYEDHGAHFFDADMDGDMDLLVISGGYESSNPDAWLARLYINLEPGKFLHAKGAIPKMEGVALRATSFDYDADGDIDLFIGGRVLPGKYPLAPASYVLRNDRNKFVDVTKEVAPEFANIGMVTDLQFGNIDEDPAPELIVVGEWMPVCVFKIAGGKLKLNAPDVNGFAQSNGFWNRLALADLDNDGDIDIITGNLGLNSNYRASADYPIQCYASDFDANGSIDPIITYFEDNTCYPMIQRDVMIKQLPILKKKYIRAHDYAASSIDDIFTAKQLKSALVLSCDMLETGWWENENGHFTFHALPVQAQISPVNSILVYDFDQDGKQDIFVAGNKYNMEVETGRLDAGTGAYFKGGKDHSFHWINNLETGIWANKDVRDAALLTGPENHLSIIISNNNDYIQVYRK